MTNKKVAQIGEHGRDESEPTSEHAEFIALVDYEVNEIRELKDIGEVAGIGWMFDAFDIRFDHRGMKATFDEKELTSESLIVTLLMRPGYVAKKDMEQEWLIAEQRAGEAKMESES